MTEQGGDHSREKTGGDSDIINYARPDIAKTHRKLLISGVISFVAILAQMPWWIGVRGFIALMYYDPGPAGVRSPPPSDWFISIVWLGVFLPTLISLAFGCYSVKVAGFGWRNTFGILGLAPVAALGVLIVVLV
jgi:hypothetical protein